MGGPPHRLAVGRRKRRLERGNVLARGRLELLEHFGHPLRTADQRLQTRAIDRILIPLDRW